MKHFAAVAAVSLAVVPACLYADDPPPGPPPPPKPFIGEMVPDTGAYGTEVTILGTGFGTSGNISFTGVASDFGQIVTSWTDTEIHVRVPFPAQVGPFTVQAPGGSTHTPTFTPTTTWKLGASLTDPTSITESRGFGSAFVAITIGSAQKATLMMIDGDSANSFALEGVTASSDPRTPMHARLVADDAGAAAVIATDSNGALQLFTLGTNTLVKHAGGLTGTLVAAGRDATGMFAWLQIVDNTNPQSPVMQVERARPGATIDVAWHVDRGPITSVDVLDAQVATDGTLVATYSKYTGSIFDNTATLGVTRLAPAASGFAATEYPDGLSYDDYIASALITMAGDGQRMIVDWSTQEYDESSDHPRSSYMRNAAGTWQADAVAGPFAYTQASIATAQVSHDGVVVTGDVTNPSTTATTVPVWPAQPIAVLTDGSGAVRPLVAAEGKVWFPAPPAQ